MVREMPVSEVKDRMGDLKELLGDEKTIFVTRHGKRKVALVDCEHWDFLLKAVQMFSHPKTRDALIECIRELRENEDA